MLAPTHPGNDALPGASAALHTDHRRSVMFKPNLIDLVAAAVTLNSARMNRARAMGVARESSVTIGFFAWL
jgi:hypothetical protein